MQGLADQGKEFGFYSKDNATSSKGLKQGISVIQVTFFLKNHSCFDVGTVSGKGQELEGGDRCGVVKV